MTTIPMTTDERPLDDADPTVNKLGINRSAFIRDALQPALRRHAPAKLEARHAAGYAAHPPTADDTAADADGIMHAGKRRYHGSMADLAKQVDKHCRRLDTLPSPSKETQHDLG